MLLFNGFAGLLLLGLWLFCLIDVITTPPGQCRNLPKIAWVLIVLLVPDIGSAAWLIAGRNWNRTPGQLPGKGPLGRPSAQPRRTRATNPDDDEEFQAQLRARVEEQRRRARDVRPGDDAAPPA